MIELTCAFCGKKYSVTLCRKNSKYCSRNCYHKASRGRTPWNAGRKPEPLSEEHKIKVGLALKGHSVSEETKKKISTSLKKWYAGPEGKEQLRKWSENPERKENLKRMTILSHTLEINKKRSESRKGYRHSEETRKKIGQSHKGIPCSDETKRKLSLINKGKTPSEETRRKISIAGKRHRATPKGQKQLEKFRQAAREANIERWRKGIHPLQDSAVRARALKASMETNRKKLEAGTHQFQNPHNLKKAISASARHNYGGTWIEKQVIVLLDEMDLEYKPQKRIPSGVSVLGRRKYLFPDFFLPEHNLLIECDGAFWHQDKEREKRRDSVFFEQGYRVLHLTGKEIRSDLAGCRAKIENLIM